MKTDYKYKPEDFKEVLGLAGELAYFYELLETYSFNKTDTNWFALEKHSRDLLFTIKHRKIEGNLTLATAEDLKRYIKELIYDKF